MAIGIHLIEIIPIEIILLLISVFWLWMLVGRRRTTFLPMRRASWKG